LARSLQGQGRLEEAERVLRYCVELEPAYWGTHLALGNFMHQHGRYAEAVEPYKRVTELTPDNPDGFNNLGVAYFDAGDWEDAEIAYRRSIELKPTRVAYTNLGTIYYYDGEYAAAVDMHRRALELAPDSFRAWGKLAAAARYVGGMRGESQSAYRKAISLAESAVQINPSDPAALGYLAVYYANVGDYETAQETIGTALEIVNDNPEVHYLHGIVSVASGDEESALAALERAVGNGYSRRLISLDPQFESIRQEERFQLLSAPGRPL
jgi:Flp pilus assembly protein TadD